MLCSDVLLTGASPHNHSGNKRQIQELRVCPSCKQQPKPLLQQHEAAKQTTVCLKTPWHFLMSLIIITPLLRWIHPVCHLSQTRPQHYANLRSRHKNILIPKGWGGRGDSTKTSTHSLTHLLLSTTPSLSLSAGRPTGHGTRWLICILTCQTGRRHGAARGNQEKHANSKVH